MRYLSFLLPGLLLCGCASVETQAFKASVGPLASAAFNENIDLVDRIANGKPLPKYVQSDVDLRKDAAATFNGLLLGK